MAAHAQGTIRGAEEGGREGYREGGPIGEVLGTVFGAAIGTVEESARRQAIAGAFAIMRCASAGSPVSLSAGTAAWAPCCRKRV